MKINLQDNDVEKPKKHKTCFYAKQKRENDTWYINSGCSNHMILNESIFTDIDTTVKSKLRMGSGVYYNTRK